MKLSELYENITAPSIERYFIPITKSSRTTSIIRIWRKRGETEWNVVFTDRVYTDDLKKAKEGKSDAFKYLGKFNFETKMACYIECVKNLIENQKPTLEMYRRDCKNR
jgi:hypothetical protein